MLSLPVFEQQSDDQTCHVCAHQALKMRVPVDVYARSPRVYRGLHDLRYPFHDQTITVNQDVED